MHTNFRRPLAAVAAAALTVGLALGGAAPAQAKVKAKDVPTKAQIIDAFPALKGGTHNGHGLTYMYVPGAQCGWTESREVTSARFSVVASDNFLRNAGVDVAEFASVSRAKEAFNQHRRFVKRCSSWSSNGVKDNLRKRSVPSLGDQRIGYFQKTTFQDGGKIFRSVVAIRRGNRVAVVIAKHPKKEWPAKRTNALARKAAKKMS